MIIKLKDGSIKEYDSPTTAAEITKDISMGLYRNACCVLVDGKVKDLRTVIDSDCSFEVLTFDDEDGKKAFNHTASHVMAQAVKRLYPNAKLTIGPSVENGFYYDFDIDTHFTQDDLDKIEKEMKAIIKENYPIEKFELPADEAVKLMEEKNEPYKIELIKEHAAKGEHISFYKQGEFTELCAGPHLMEMKVIKAFKLTNCTGAYWRGDADNKMLCRVYGIAFPKASMLEDYLNKARSYRDLPLRYDETSTLFRNEASGEMHGLIRVRQFTISEGHLMCTPDQLEDEFRSCLELATFMLKTLGLYEGLLPCH